MKKHLTLVLTLLIAGTAWASSELNSAVQKADAPLTTAGTIVKAPSVTPHVQVPVLDREGDTCDDPIIATLPYEYFGTTADNGDDNGDGAPDEWHLFSIDAFSQTVVTLCGGGTTYDSYLYLMADDCITEVAVNDDACELVSEITIALDPGDYVVGVDAFSSNSGDYQLNITADTEIDPPPNDACEDAEAIEGPYPVTVSGTVEDATIDCPGLLDWNAVWYTIDLPYEMQTVTVDWCETPADPEITNYGIIYMDDCACDDYVAGAYGWDCENGNLILSWGGVVGPATIYLPVLIEGATDFTITVDVEGFEPSDGDACVSPLIVPELPYNFVGTTADNSDTYGNASPDEWHYFTLWEDSDVIIDLCSDLTDYDTYMYLLSGDCATELAYNDDGPDCPESPAPYAPSYIEATLSAGDYVVAVDGYSSGNSGNYELFITADGYEPPEYPNCQYPPHTPDDSWSAGTSHNNGDDVNYMRADRFGDAGLITGVTFYGLSMIYDGSWVACEEDPMTFDVTFYEDGMMPGEPVCNYLVEASPVPSGDAYAGFPAYEWTVELPDACPMEAGWVGIQSVGNCWFLWMSTGSGADGVSAISTDGGAWEEYAYDMTWCLTLSQDVADSNLPASVMLHDNHPNPFNPTTTISYELTAAQQVDLVVFNVTGEKVATLVSGAQTASTHEVQFNGADLPSGIYFYQLTAGEFTQTNRMLLVK